MDKEVVGIDERLLSLVKKEQQQQLTLLTTVPGIGTKTALFLIVVTDGFSKFETAAQLCSYVGITPVIRESGSSVRGRSRISKAIENSGTYCFFVLSTPVSTIKLAVICTSESSERERARNWR